MRLQGCLNSYVSILLSSELEGNFGNVEKTQKKEKEKHILRVFPETGLKQMQSVGLSNHGSIGYIKAALSIIFSAKVFKQ